MEPALPAEFPAAHRIARQDPNFAPDQPGPRMRQILYRLAAAEAGAVR